MRRILLLLCSLLFPASYALAHPVAYQGATGVMFWDHGFMADYWVTHSFRPDLAVAARGLRMDMDDGERSWFYGPQLDYLLKRWNQTDSQANVYVYGAWGGVKSGTRTGTAPLVGIEADIESRKYFALAKFDALFPTTGRDTLMTELRLGVAPYEAEFNEIASWLMIQFQHHPAIIRESALTPFVRLMYRNFLVEAGVSFEGDGMFNFMFHF